MCRNLELSQSTFPHAPESHAFDMRYKFARSRQNFSRSLIRCKSGVNLVCPQMGIESHRCGIEMSAFPFLVLFSFPHGDGEGFRALLLSAKGEEQDDCVTDFVTIGFLSTLSIEEAEVDMTWLETYCVKTSFMMYWRRHPMYEAAQPC